MNSKPFLSEDKIFAGEEIFPYRIKLKAVFVPKDLVDFRPLVPKLTFIKNKKAWSWHIRIAMREIPESDYITIRQALESSI